MYIGVSRYKMKPVCLRLISHGDNYSVRLYHTILGKTMEKKSIQKNVYINFKGRVLRGP